MACECCSPECRGERLRERGQGETAANFCEVGSDGRKRRLGRPAQEVKHAEAEPADEGLRNEVGEAEAWHDRGDGLVQRFRHVPCEGRRAQRRTADPGDRDRLDVLRRDAERCGGCGVGELQSLSQKPLDVAVLGDEGRTMRVDDEYWPSGL